MNLLGFFRKVNRLKGIKRSGWVERGVKDPETVAGHSFMVALMVLVLAKEREIAENIDREKVVKMALIHDLAEAETGDIITEESRSRGEGEMSRKEKLRLERKGLEKMLSNLDREPAGEIKELWEEYERGKTREAKFVRDIDLAEMLLQAYRYYKEGNFQRPLEGFWDERNLGKIKNEKIRKMVRDVVGQD